MFYLMRKEKVLQILLYISGVLSILYSIALNVFISFTNIFHYFFLFVGLILVIFGIGFKQIHKRILHLPKWVFRIGFGFAIVGFVFFSVIEGIIICAAVQDTPSDLSHIIVLGAGLKGDKPSLTLKQRLDKSYEYLMDHPNTKVIVSGGQGFDEPVTEASAMERYLLDKGIKKERIIKEEASTSTYENLKFTKDLLYERGEDVTALKIGIVSNDFHIFRALHLAKELAYGEVYGCSAKSITWLKPNNYIREAFAVVKDCIL